MQDTVDYTAPFATPSPAVPSTEPRKLAIRFTGSGSEYFRIWIVNLLLILVTLGIYFPWAKVRKLRYFYGNTLVDGEALGFHADPKTMFKGYALVAVLFACYSLAGYWSPVAALLALALIAALWPALFKASMQFRLANTSWRGLRFRFMGTTQAAYQTVLPLFGLGALMVALPTLQAEEDLLPDWLSLSLSLAVLGGSVMVPWLLQRLKRYQHDHYALGQEQTAFSAGAGSFYGVFFKYMGVAVLSAVPLGLAMVGLGMGVGVGMQGMEATLFLLMGPLVLAWYALLFAYGTSRFQNLVWNHTTSQHVQFHSALTLRPLLFLHFKNFLLMVFTLGLYWPFAAVALGRMRLESVHMVCSIDVEQLVASGLPAQGDAAGDAAGDFLGIDIGL